MVIYSHDYIFPNPVLFLEHGRVYGIGSWDPYEFGFQITIFEGEPRGSAVDLGHGIVYCLRPPSSIFSLYEDFLLGF